MVGVEGSVKELQGKPLLPFLNRMVLSNARHAFSTQTKITSMAEIGGLPN